MLFAFCRCGDAIKSGGKINQGAITYHVSYSSSEKDNPIIALLPNQIELRFKDNNISLISEGYLGFFSTRFISKYQDPNSNILLKVLDKKLNYQLPKDEIAFIYNQPAPVHIEFTDSTKIIAGYTCKMVILHSSEKGAALATAYYTSDINLTKPNRNTPLAQIPWVLMQFETTINQVKTKFTAQKVSMIEIPEEEFNIPDEYIPADIAAIKKYIVNFK